MAGRDAAGTSEGGRGRANPVIVALLAGILVAVIALIAVVFTQAPAPSTRPVTDTTVTVDPASSAVADGPPVRRSDLPSPPKAPRAIDDPDRIRETLRVGKVYTATLKAGLDARAEDKAWWRKEIISLAYAAEMRVERSIEENDGRRIVELRHFVASRNVKLLCDVESASIDLGQPGALILGALSAWRPGATAVVAAVKPIADGILGVATRKVVEGRVAKVVGHVDSLAGKSVRIVYVDGIGVESIDPIERTLSDREKDFVFATAVLSDSAVWDLRKPVGTRWDVDGAQLAGLVDPSLRGATSGEIAFVRGPDEREGDASFASLRIEAGTLEIDTSDASARRIGSFNPRGTLRFDLAEKYVSRARLVGRVALEEVSKDHILFETSFRSRPTLTVDYACTIR